MTTTDQALVEPTLDDTAAREVAALVDRAERADGAPALNEAALLNLRGTEPGVTHLRVVHGDATVGYAQLVEATADGAPASTGQLVVDPAARRRGVGTTLLRALREQAAHPLQVWAMGDTEAAAALARTSGLVPVRSLSIMTRRLDDLPAPVVPEGVRIDTFRPGVDEDAWLTINRRAFAHHPEQGAITADDLARRMAEPWFDPAGFFLARAVEDPDGPVLGFHWTKRHPDGLGEVYVIGVDPDAEGRGLAKALLLVGLAWLREQGAGTVELYVESDSARAVGLYESRSFVFNSRDVMYGEPGGATS